MPNINKKKYETKLQIKNFKKKQKILSTVTKIKHHMENVQSRGKMKQKRKKIFGYKKPQFKKKVE